MSQNAEYVCRTTHGQAVYCRIVLGIHRTVVVGDSSITSPGDFRLVIDENLGLARKPLLCVSPLLDRAIYLIS